MMAVYRYKFENTSYVSYRDPVCKEKSNRSAYFEDQNLEQKCILLVSNTLVTSVYLLRVVFFFFEICNVPESLRFERNVGNNGRHQNIR